MDVNHPDILEFIKMKRDLSQVTGANISIKLNDEFMQAVETDGDYLLRFPCDMKMEDINFNALEYDVLDDWTGSIPRYFKKIKAKEYWDEIIKSAHNVAEPGLMYWNQMVNYSPDGVYPQFKQITTNPCSEIGMQAYDACRLIAVNLFSFVDNPFTNEAKFNLKKFYEINYEAMRLGDNLIDLEIIHIDRIIAKIESDPEPLMLKITELTLWKKIKETALASRRTGIGFTALGDTIAALNLKYDSEEALSMIEQIMHTKMESELDCTIDLSILRGSFNGWDKDLEFDLITSNELVGNNDFYNFIAEEFPIQADKMFTFGRRNVSWSTVAPTGTVSLMAQTTSGIEPLFQPYYIRRKKVNPGENVKVDFVDDNGDSWQEFSVIHPKFKDWITLNADSKYSVDELDRGDLEGFFEESPWYKSTANDINWSKRVEIQSIIQKYITHSISSTVNLPEDVTEQEVSDIYTSAWKLGVKGITVYREGSRSGVLITKPSTSKFIYKDSIKRPKEVTAKAYTTISNNKKYSVFVGLVDNIPYEVFAYLGGTREGGGKINKEGRGEYYFIGDNDNSRHRILTGKMNEEQEIITRLISGSLRHGRGINFIVDDLNKTSGSLFSFNFAIAKILKLYIPDGVKSSTTCNECGSANVIFEEGCNKCLDCGNSKCG
jgi:ribonucleoside-diphosphate reductase alpha chain